MSDPVQERGGTTDTWGWKDVFGMVLRTIGRPRPKDAPRSGLKELVVRIGLGVAMLFVIGHVFGWFDDDRAFGGIIYLLIVAAIYFVPTLVATARNHPQRGAIIALNILLGWTFIGWVVAMVWSLINQSARQG